MQSFFIRVLSIALLSSLLSGCFDTQADSPPASVDTWIETQAGERAIEIQVALTEPERQKGLMFRDSMGEQQGMLFVFESPRPLGFWMKNTRIPLDIAYITPDGTIREIYPMYPFNENSVRSRRTDLSMALEMNQGWFAAHGVVPGQTIELAPVVDLIERRGLDPAAFAIQLSN